MSSDQITGVHSLWQRQPQTGSLLQEPSLKPLQRCADPENTVHRLAGRINFFALRVIIIFPIFFFVFISVVLEGSYAKLQAVSWAGGQLWTGGAVRGLIGRSVHW